MHETYIGKEGFEVGNPQMYNFETNLHEDRSCHLSQELELIQFNNLHLILKISADISSLTDECIDLIPDDHNGPWLVHTEVRRTGRYNRYSS